MVSTKPIGGLRGYLNLTFSMLELKRNHLFFWKFRKPAPLTALGCFEEVPQKTESSIGFQPFLHLTIKDQRKSIIKIDIFQSICRGEKILTILCIQTKIYIEKMSRFFFFFSFPLLQPAIRVNIAKKNVANLKFWIPNVMKSNPEEPDFQRRTPGMILSLVLSPSPERKFSWQ